jgi:hypothetical protein
MLFTNPEIIRNCDDLKIGKVYSHGDKMNFLNYSLNVRLRVLKKVIDFVKFDMGEGATKEESLNDCLQLVYSMLNIENKDYPQDEEGIAEEIYKSEEFSNWINDIKYRFLATHTGVTSLSTPIEVSLAKAHPNVMQETIELVEEEDSLQVLLNGLAATNYLD